MWWGIAPTDSITRPTLARSSSRAPSGQIIQAAPLNNVGVAAVGPACSLPAIGWPATKRRPGGLALTTGSLTPATSVTNASVRSWRRVASVALSGPARITRSTRSRASSAVEQGWSMAPRRAATARAEVSGSQPAIVQPACRRAIPNDAPINPVPRMAARCL